MLEHADIVKVKVLEGYKLKLFFEDGSCGDVNLEELIPFQGIFEPLGDLEFFNKVFVNTDIGTICWENGADLSPEFLYSQIKNNIQ